MSVNHAVIKDEVNALGVNIDVKERDFVVVGFKSYSVALGRLWRRSK